MSFVFTPTRRSVEKATAERVTGDIFSLAEDENCVIDLRHADEGQAAAAVSKAFQQRQTAKDHLDRAIPQMQKQVLRILKESF